QNGFLRPNPYRSQLNYDEKDYNRVIHPYEYKDYYLNEYLTIATPHVNPDSTISYTYQSGTDMYSYLDIPSFNGNYTFFEMPKFLEFEYFELLVNNNPAYL